MTRGTPCFSQIAQQQRQALAELGAMRRDLKVLAGVLTRRDTTLLALLAELRAVHSIASRVRDHEARRVTS